MSNYTKNAKSLKKIEKKQSKTHKKLATKVYKTPKTGY